MVSMSETPDKKLAVIGQGYVGLPLSLSAARAGFKVIGIDSNQERVAQLLAGESFVPDVTNGDLLEMKALGYIPSPSYSDIAGFEIAVITVPTPLSDGKPDLRSVESAARSVGEFLRPRSLVILESTTYPGTTRELVIPILEDRSGLKAGADFSVGYSPERIDPGNRRWNIENTPKVISGLETACAQKVAEFYATFVDEVCVVESLETAELTKLLENTFRHTNIALVNELAKFSNGLGVNIWQAINAAATKPFGFMKFLPGPGVGGHCLPIDPTFLSWKAEQVSGEKFTMIHSANDVNAAMPAFVVKKLLDNVDDARVEKSILIVGLSYKENTGDIRESPSLEIINLLQAAGHRVAALDPLVPAKEWPEGLERVGMNFSETFDLCVVACLHDQINVQAILNQSTLVFDSRNYFEGIDAGNIVTF